MIKFSTFDISRSGVMIESANGEYVLFSDYLLAEEKLQQVALSKEANDKLNFQIKNNLHSQLLKAIKERDEKNSTWHSISEKKPEYERLVIIATKDGRVIPAILRSWRHVVTGEEIEEFEDDEARFLSIPVSQVCKWMNMPMHPDID